MKKNLLTGLLVAVIVLSALSGCGRRGEDTPPPTGAVLTLSASGSLPAASLIGGIDVEVLLPAGVTVKASPHSSNPQVMVAHANVVFASGAASGADSVLATYLTSTKSLVRIQVVKANGFSTGEFATMDCDIATGSFPAATDFSLADFKAFDLNGAIIPGLTAGFTAAIE